MPGRVRITDVSPRDGLQNEPGVIPTPDKARLIELLSATGVDEIEVSSFVSAKWVPQLGDATELFRAIAALEREGRIPPLPSGKGGARPVFSALVPNDRGMQGALDANQAAAWKIVGKVAVFTAASETFSKRNTNATIAETLDRFRSVIGTAHHAGLPVRGYVSCVIACPFEGPIAPQAVVEVCRQLVQLGVSEIDLGDTIGEGTHDSIVSLLKTYSTTLPIRGGVPLTLHLHDTFGRAADCVRAALDQGVRSFDGSVAGLGGCPYAGTPGKPAPGNISTELLVRTIRMAGYETGVDEAKLAQAAAFAREIVARARRTAPSE